MRGRPLSLLLPALLLVLEGCTRYVVKADSDPAGATVTLGGSAGKGNRWSVPSDQTAEIAATWPDGQRMATALTVDRDMHVLLRKDGDPAQVVGARLAVAPTPTPTPAPTDTTTAPVPTLPINPGAAPATPPSSGPEGRGVSDTMTRAKALADAGQKAYELAEYDEAIAKFKQAYELIRDSKDPKAPEILGNLFYNMAVVYERSYDVKPDAERLRKARVMYKQFDEQMASLVQSWSSTAEHADVLRRIRALDTRLDKQVDKPSP